MTEFVYRIHFERIGRHRDIAETVTVHDDDGEQLIAAIIRVARCRLASPSFAVTADWDPDSGSGTGFLEGGRYGTFTIERVGASPSTETSTSVDAAAELRAVADDTAIREHCAAVDERADAGAVDLDRPRRGWLLEDYQEEAPRGR